jgi:hypothetical protein
MAKITIKKASTDVTLYVFIQASNVTTGAGLTGLVYNTTDLVASYVRPKAARAALSLATQTVDGNHSDGGFVEVDATNMPGVYRLDLPDAVCATGVPSVVVMLKGAANMAPVLLEIQLTDFDLNTAAITAATIADAVWDEAIADHTTATTFGGKNQKVVPSETINDYKADVSAITGASLSATGIDAIVDEVIVGTYTMRQLLTVFASALAGKLSGGGTTTLTFRGINDASNVIVATVDANGNRSDLTITV